jgi:putative hydrolase of the HAD superfamily
MYEFPETLYNDVAFNQKTKEYDLILPQNRPTAIFFDLDDTLFDHQYSDHAGLAAAFEHNGAFANLPTDELIPTTGGIMDGLWPQVMAGELSLEDWPIVAFQQLFAHYDMASELAVCQTAAQHYRQGYLTTWRTIDGAIELLDQLRGEVMIGVITNHLTVEQRLKLDQLKLGPFIDFMVCVDDADAAKPDAPMFELALQKANAQPENVVMVGDSWSHDVMGATALGMPAVWLNRGGRVCPDPTLATEIQSLRPTENLVRLLLQR